MGVIANGFSDIHSTYRKLTDQLFNTEIELFNQFWNVTTIDTEHMTDNFVSFSMEVKHIRYTPEYIIAELNNSDDLTSNNLYVLEFDSRLFVLNCEKCHRSTPTFGKLLPTDMFMIMLCTISPSKKVTMKDGTDIIVSSIPLYWGH